MFHQRNWLDLLNICSGNDLFFIPNGLFTLKKKSISSFLTKKYLNSNVISNSYEVRNLCKFPYDRKINLERNVSGVSLKYVRLGLNEFFLKFLVVFHWIDPPKNSQNFAEKSHYPYAIALKISLRTHSNPAWYNLLVYWTQIFAGNSSRDGYCNPLMKLNFWS